MFPSGWHEAELINTPARQLASAGMTERRGSEALSKGMCCQCGGSGVLRLDGQRYRTCMACVGQGRQRPRSLLAAEVLQIPLPRLQEPISGSASSAAA